MRTIEFSVPDELEEEFRRAAMGQPSAVDLLDGIAADTELAERAESGVEIKDEIGRRRADVCVDADGR